ncbi:MAG: energy transducer TonB [Dysgonamonadaceae bacterium]|jgi:TonB family protein|nr:energy transducer TonB [Dysgonamonadaceae bacterium]
MKTKSYRLLFRVFSFLSDKTNGFPLFAKYKLLLGTLILGLSATSCTNKKTMQAVCYEPALPQDTIEPIMCYEPAVPQDTQEIVRPAVINTTIEMREVAIDSMPVIESVISCYEPIPEPKPDTIRIYNHVEQMPQFPGGDRELMKFLSDNINFPAVTCYETGVSGGRVVVRFIVTSEGEIINPEIVRSAHPALDKEAVRVIKIMPRWIPGKQNGKNVDVYYTLPVSVHLQ